MSERPKILSRRDLLTIVGVSAGTVITMDLIKMGIFDKKRNPGLKQDEIKTNPSLGRWDVISINSEDVQKKSYRLELDNSFYYTSVPGFSSYGKYLDETEDKNSNAREGNLLLYEFPSDPNGFHLKAAYSLKDNQLKLIPIHFNSINNPPEEIIFRKYE